MSGVTYSVVEIRWDRDSADETYVHDISESMSLEDAEERQRELEVAYGSAHVKFAVQADEG